MTDDNRGLVDLRYEIDDDWCEHCGVRLSVRPCGCGPTGYDEDAERIEANHVRIHFPEPDRDCIDALRDPIQSRAKFQCTGKWVDVEQDCATVEQAGGQDISLG